jgi:hypothetical protein
VSQEQEARSTAWQSCLVTTRPPFTSAPTKAEQLTTTVIYGLYQPDSSQQVEQRPWFGGGAPRTGRRRRPARSGPRRPKAGA